MTDERWRGRPCLVTGAASGMGAAVVERLVDRGARVHAVDRQAVAAPVAEVSICDLRHAGEIEDLVGALTVVPDAVFCCAGLPQTFPAVDVVAVNFLANRLLVDRLAPRLSPGSAIAVISSVTYGWERTAAALAPLVDTPSFAAGIAWYEEHDDPTGDPYVTSKLALTAWAVRRAVGLAAGGVRLNVLGPGTTETPMLPAFRQALGAGALDAVPCPIGRRSTPAEQADALIFLNDPAARSLVGAVLYNDGGTSATLAAAAFERSAR